MKLIHCRFFVGALFIALGLVPVARDARTADFAPLPRAASLEQFSREEIDCGATTLFADLNYSGKIKGFWIMRGLERREYSYRYYVINQKGIEAVKRQIRRHRH